jgi:hypothetical protein
LHFKHWVASPCALATLLSPLLVYSKRLLSNAKARGLLRYWASLLLFVIISIKLYFISFN